MLRALFLSLALFCTPVLAEDAMVHDVTVLGRTPSDLAAERVTLKSQPVAIIDAKGKLAEAPTELPKAIDALKAKLDAKGIQAAGAALVKFNAASDQAYEAEIMLPLAVMPKDPIEGVRFGTSPEGPALRVVHKGPLSSIEDTYFEIQTFVEDQGLEAGDTTIERYVTNPAITTPKDMVTEIYVPLK